MRTEDIALALSARLPQLVDDFTNSHAITSLTRAGTTATATTSEAHGLTVGQAVNIVGAETPINCTISRSGVLVTITTDQDHDYTQEQDAVVIVDQSTDFDGAHTIQSVPNRRTVTYLTADTGAASGSGVVTNGTNPFQTYNGYKSVSAVPSETSFEYAVPDNIFTPASGSPTAKTSPRVGAAVDLSRLMDSYTKELPGDAWLFVVMGDGAVSKNRRIDTDATDNIQPGQYFNQRIIQTFSLFLFLPSAHEIKGRSVRDRAEELLRPICRSILLDRFDSLLAVGELNPVQFLEHGIEAYTGAFYVHRYTFEATLQMSGGDIFVPDESVAFRDIEHTALATIGSESTTAKINLDDQPLG
jgi:hypothetical protein